MWYIIKTQLDKKSWGYVFLGLTLVAIEVAANIAVPILLTFLSGVITKTDHLNFLETYSKQIQALIIMFIMLAIAIIGLVAGIFGEIVNAKFAIDITRRLRINTFNKIQHFSNADFDNFSTASLITRLTTDLFLVQESLIFVFKIVYRGVLLYIGGVIGIAIIIGANHATQYNYVIPVLVVLISLLMIIIGTLIMYLSVVTYDKFLKQVDNVNEIVRDNILGIRVTKAFNLYEIQQMKFEVQNNKLKNIGIKSDLVWQFGIPLVDLVMNVTIVAVLGFGALTNSIQIAQIVTLVQLITMMMLGLVLVMVVVGNLGVAYSGAKRIKEVLVYKPVINYLGNEQITNGNIEIKNLTFKYHNTGANVLNDLNLKINQGETLGIIGGTGAGKSTLINLIARLYDYKEGLITISGHDLKEISESSLRQNIGLVQQHAFLFEGTIAANLLMANPHASKEALIKATQQAQAYEFIMHKKKQFQAHVDQRGENFSGGQKQRLSLARTLLKNPKILILDDVTSALDFLTEKKVLHNLRTDFPNQTKIIVSQKISSIIHADKILVLDDGFCVGYGTHTQLMQSCSLYKEIYHSQNDKRNV